MLLLLLVFSLLLAGCQPSSSAIPEHSAGRASKDQPHVQTTPGPRFEIEVQPSPQGHDLPREIKAEIFENRVVFHVRDTFGIGSGTVRLIEGDWPPKILIHFHLKGLEGISVKVGGKLLQDQNNEPRVPLAVRLVDLEGKPLEGKYLLKRKGYYEANIPAAALSDGARQLEFSWIDFYRR